MKKYYFILLLLVGMIVAPGNANSPPNYTYSITQDPATEGYMLRIQFQTTYTIDMVNVTIHNTTYVMQQDTKSNAFFVHVPTDLQGQEVNVRLLSEQGLQEVTFKIPSSDQSSPLNSVWLTIGLTMALLLILSKYVLFFNDKNNNQEIIS